jgi:hypothetical protein
VVSLHGRHVGWNGKSPLENRHSNHDHVKSPSTKTKLRFVRMSGQRPWHHESYKVNDLIDHSKSSHVQQCLTFWSCSQQCFLPLAACAPLDSQQESSCVAAQILQTSQIYIMRFVVLSLKRLVPSNPANGRKHRVTVGIDSALRRRLQHPLGPEVGHRVYIRGRLTCSCPA